MSEKGQGDLSAEGAGRGVATGVGVDGQADQSGSHVGTVPTDEAIEDAIGAYEDRELERTFMEGLGKPELPDLPEEPDAEPAFPGGPTDTRSGWDYPSGEGPRGDQPEWQSQPEPEQSAGEVEEESNRPKRKRRRQAGGELSAPDLKPNPTDRPPGLSDEQFEQWKKDHPTGLDKANTQTNVT